MPELPEVEVTKRGIEDFLLHRKIMDIYHDGSKLRKLLTDELYNLKGGMVSSIVRRGKYILITTDRGSLLIHLGMTGHLSVLSGMTQRGTHDHFEIITENNVIRYSDIRKFGLIEFFKPGCDPYENPPLNALGPEPFDEKFSAAYLYSRLSKKNITVKQALMDNAIVVGIGNIYASEILFRCGISPLRKSDMITAEECEKIVRHADEVLRESIDLGGTTIRDFQGADGKLGYFVQNLNVYGHEHEPCRKCKTPIRKIVQGQRSTFYCQVCQK